MDNEKQQRRLERWHEMNSCYSREKGGESRSHTNTGLLLRQRL